MDILQTIRKHRESAVQKVRNSIPLEKLREYCSERTEFRPFRQTMLQSGIRIIAELKQASPSRGLLLDHFDPETLSKQYNRGGAAALSVLTEPNYFRGSLLNLKTARSATNLPILQKDFIFDPYQLYEGAAAGADAILLIVPMLSDSELARLYETAVLLNLVPVVEIYDETDIDRLKPLPRNTFIGINNRNLRTFDTNVRHAMDLVDRILVQDNYPIIFSGIHGRDDITFYSDRTKMFLIGEYLVTAPDRIKALRNLLS